MDVSRAKNVKLHKTFGCLACPLEQVHLCSCGPMDHRPRVVYCSVWFGRAVKEHPRSRTNHTRMVQRFWRKVICVQTLEETFPYFSCMYLFKKRRLKESMTLWLSQSHRSHQTDPKRPLRGASVSTKRYLERVPVRQLLWCGANDGEFQKG